MAPNSLFGAMAVGGVGLALRLRERWPSIALTETHPKVLFYALHGSRYTDVATAARWWCHIFGRRRRPLIAPRLLKMCGGRPAFDLASHH